MDDQLTTVDRVAARGRAVFHAPGHCTCTPCRESGRSTATCTDEACPIHHPRGLVAL